MSVRNKAISESPFIKIAINSYMFFSINLTYAIIIIYLAKNVNTILAI